MKPFEDKTMSRNPSVGRRGFLKSAAVTGAAAFIGGAGPSGDVTAQQSGPAGSGTAPTLPREADPSGEVDVLTTDRPGGDFMVDVIKTLNIDYIAANPGSR